jgi:hypothetical protein
MDIDNLLTNLYIGNGDLKNKYFNYLKTGKDKYIINMITIYFDTEIDINKEKNKENLSNLINKMIYLEQFFK